MNQWFVLVIICCAAGGVDAISQKPAYMLTPNGEMLYFPDGLPPSFIGQKPVMPITLPMLLRVPGPPAGSVLPLALWPQFNKFNPFLIPNGLHKQPASASVLNSTSTVFVSGNETTTSITVSSEKTTSLPIATTQSHFALSSPTGIQINQPVTRPSASIPAYSTPSPSLAISPSPIITVQRNGDYNFAYSVNDRETGDIKNHEEKRLNGIVTGYYSLVDPENMLRKVNYTADGNGFRATVSKLPITSQ